MRTTTTETPEPAKDISEKTLCSACGEAFSCGAKAGSCWCFAVELTAETATRLREDFENCLCADCLQKFANESSSGAVR